MRTRQFRCNLLQRILTQGTALRSAMRNLGAAGSTALNTEVARQAAMVAFLNDVALMMIMALAPATSPRNQGQQHAKPEPVRGTSLAYACLAPKVRRG
jgi:hypothetical protein